MADRQKVIKALELCLDEGPIDFDPCEKCPYNDGDPWKCNRMKADALSLLKEQENMVPARAVAEWLAEYAAPPLMKIVPGTHEGRTFAWLAALKQIGAGRE